MPPIGSCSLNRNCLNRMQYLGGKFWISANLPVDSVSMRTSGEEFFRNPLAKSNADDYIHVRTRKKNNNERFA